MTQETVDDNITNTETEESLKIQIKRLRKERDILKQETNKYQKMLEEHRKEQSLLITTAASLQKTVETLSQIVDVVKRVDNNMNVVRVHLQTHTPEPGAQAVTTNENEKQRARNTVMTTEDLARDNVMLQRFPHGRGKDIKFIDMNSNKIFYKKSDDEIYTRHHYVCKRFPDCISHAQKGSVCKVCKAEAGVPTP